MPTLAINGTNLHYEERGSGPETIVFSHGYLLDSTHFEPQIEELSKRYRCIAFDHRGHGKSERPVDGYHLENLYADAVGVLEAVGRQPVHFVGLSTGGFIGLRLGVRRPDLLRSLTLLGTSASGEPPWKRLKYEAMIQMIRMTGFTLLGPYLLSLLFAQATRRDPARRDEILQVRRVLDDNDRHVAVAFGHGVLYRRSVLEQVHRIQVPTAVVVGQEDRVQPIARAKAMAERMPDATLVLVPKASHLCSIDRPEIVTDTILDQIAVSTVVSHDPQPQPQV